jgi:phosphomannomutase
MERAIELFRLFLLSKKKTFYTGNVCVCVGGDNRPSTKRIVELVKLGIKSQGANPLDFGLTTTPQLFFYGNWHAIQFPISIGL